MEIMRFLLATLILTNLNLNSTYSMQEDEPRLKGPSLKELCFLKMPEQIRNILSGKTCTQIDFQSSETLKLQPLIQSIPGGLLEECAMALERPTHVPFLRDLVCVTRNHTSGCSNKETNAIEFFDIPGRKKTKHLQSGSFAHHAALSPNGKYLAVMITKSGKPYIQMWNTKTNQVIKTVTVNQHDFDAMIFPNPHNLIIADSDHIWVWEFKEKDPSSIKAHRTLNKKMAFMPQQNYLVYSHPSHTTQHRIEVLDFTSGDKVRQFGPQSGTIETLIAHHRKNIVASVQSSSPTAYVWDIDKPEGAENIGCFKHKNKVKSLCFDPEGNYLACGTDALDHRVYLWNISSQQCLAHYSIDMDSAIEFLSWAEDNSSLIAKNARGKVFQWKPEHLFAALALKLKFNEE